MLTVVKNIVSRLTNIYIESSQMVVWEGKGNIFLVYLVPKFGDPKTLIAGTYNKTKMT